MLNVQLLIFFPALLQCLALYSQHKGNLTWKYLVCAEVNACLDFSNWPLWYATTPSNSSILRCLQKSNKNEITSHSIARFLFNFQMVSHRRTSKNSLTRQFQVCLFEGVRDGQILSHEHVQSLAQLLKGVFLLVRATLCLEA